MAAMSSEAREPGIATAVEPPDWHPDLPASRACEVLRHEVAGVAAHLPTARPPAPLEPLPFAGGNRAMGRI